MYIKPSTWRSVRTLKRKLYLNIFYIHYPIMSFNWLQSIESTRFLVNEDKQKRCIEMVKPFPQQLYLLAHHFSCKRIFVKLPSLIGNQAKAIKSTIAKKTTNNLTLLKLPVCAFLSYKQWIKSYWGIKLYFMHCKK